MSHQRSNRSSFSVTHKPITEDRKDVYLRVLAETGSHPAAARAASPHLADSPGARPGYSSFADLRHMDPEFAQACEEAERAALGKVEQAIVERAFTLDERPIFGKDGVKLGVQTDSRPANQMLLRLAERLAPADWSPRKQQSITAEHQHTHEHRHGVVFELRHEHIMLLPTDRQRAFVNDLQLIRTAMERREVTDDRQHRAPATEVAAPPRGDAAAPGDGDERTIRAGR